MKVREAMVRCFLVFSIGLTSVLAGCGDGPGVSHAHSCGEFFPPACLCEFSCRPPATTLAQGTALLNGVATRRDNGDGTTSFMFDCSDDNTPDGYAYEFVFDAQRLRYITYRGRGSYDTPLPACVAGCGR